MKLKKDIIFIALSLVLLLLAAGCKAGGKDTAGKSPTTPFLGGAKGVDIKFLDGSPPDEVTDGSGTTGNFPFQAVVVLKNIGETDIGANNLKVSLSGFLPSDFGSGGVGSPFADGDLINKLNAVNLQARQRDSEGNIMEPVEAYFTFPKDLTALNNEFFNFKAKLAGNTVFDFKADVCYKYQTKAVAEICALKNLIDVDGDAICDPRGTKPIFSSSAPIGITSFRQNVLGANKLQFSFDIVHSGQGHFFSEEKDAAGAAKAWNSYKACAKTMAEKRAREDYVKVTVSPGISDANVQCVGVTTSAAVKAIGSVKLIDGKRSITCILDLNAARQTDFKKSIDITLDYSYLDSIKKDVLVKHLLGSECNNDCFCDAPPGGSENLANCPQDCAVSRTCGDTCCSKTPKPANCPLSC